MDKLNNWEDSDLYRIYFELDNPCIVYNVVKGSGENLLSGYRVLSSRGETLLDKCFIAPLDRRTAIRFANQDVTELQADVMLRIKGLSI